MGGKNKNATRLNFLDPLDIFGGQKAAAAQSYGQQQSAVSAQQQAMVNKMMAERGVYSQRAENLLGQSPTYTVPIQAKQYQNLMSQEGQRLGTTLSGLAQSLKAQDYTQGGQEALTSAYGDVRGYANKGAASLRDIMRGGVNESAALAKTGMETGLKDVNTFTDYYRQLASRQEMPGQTATESKMGRSYAEGYRALSQQAGGSASGLGAMVDLYTNKSEALADLGIQASQYRAQQEAQLGSALQNAQAIRSQIYDTASQGAMSRAGAMAGAEQTASGMQIGAAQAQGEAMSQYALNRQGAAQSQASTLANIYNQGITGQANLQGAGLMTGAEYADQSFQYNELLPYQQQMNYYLGQISSLNPYAAQSDVYASQMNSINNMYQLFGKKATWGQQ